MELTIDEYWRLNPIQKQIRKLCDRENRTLQLLKYGRSYGKWDRTKEWRRGSMQMTIGEDSDMVNMW